jgi:hypothetical protein
VVDADEMQQREETPLVLEGLNGRIVGAGQSRRAAGPRTGRYAMIYCDVAAYIAARMGLIYRPEETFLKTSIAGATAATVGMPLSEQAEAAVKAGEKGWQWDKGVCRFCGTGCGIMVATKGGRSWPPRATRMRR